MRSPSTTRQPASTREQGIALIVTLMILVLISALMVGFMTAIIADTRASGLDRDQTQAYAGAHAGLEQLTSDLSGLFTQDFSPSAAQIATLTATPPVLTGFQFIESGRQRPATRSTSRLTRRETRRPRTPRAARFPPVRIRASRGSSRPTTSP